MSPVPFTVSRVKGSLWGPLSVSRMDPLFIYPVQGTSGPDLLDPNKVSSTPITCL